MDSLHLNSKKRGAKAPLFFFGNVAFYLLFDMMKEGKQRKEKEGQRRAKNAFPDCQKRKRQIGPFRKSQKTAGIRTRRVLFWRRVLDYLSMPQMEKD